jgi:hypothetical protein
LRSGVQANKEMLPYYLFVIGAGKGSSFRFEAIRIKVKH